MVAVQGKGSNPKTVLYVGGLEESVTELGLKSAFIPFGPVKEVNIPLDHETGKHRGFGFVEFEDREDAADAIDNMHNGELFGRCAHLHSPLCRRGAQSALFLISGPCNDCHVRVKVELARWHKLVAPAVCLQLSAAVLSVSGSPASIHACMSEHQRCDVTRKPDY